MWALPVYLPAALAAAELFEVAYRFFRQILQHFFLFNCFEQSVTNDAPAKRLDMLFQIEPGDNFFDLLAGLVMPQKIAENNAFAFQ